MSFYSNLLGSAGVNQPTTTYEISRSVRFNNSDSAYLSATFGTPTDQDVFTLSMWVKRSALGSTQQLFGVSTDDSFGFTSGDALRLTFGSGGAITTFTTTALFRDPSAWYHIMWVQNGTSHTLYVNGTSVGTVTATSNIFNTAVAHQIGAGNTTNFFNGYLAYIHFIDGQAKAPGAFGADDNNGIWQPIVYVGNYGANGFQLEMDDNSTAAALGTDTSGNGNTWTVNNISVTAGAGNDSLVDSPTNGTETDTGVGGEVRGNYCTLNTVVGGANVSDITFSNGNLEATWASGGPNYAVALGTIGVSSGKWYWETTIAGASNFWIFGIAAATSSLTSFIGAEASSYSYYSVNGQTYNNNSSTVYGNTYTTNDVIGVALDLDNGKIFFSKNGTWQNSGSPTGGTNAAYTGLSGTFFPAYSEGTANADSAYICNFGQRPFAYTAPSGFKALCTTNLPAPTIENGSTAMDVVTYTGNGSTQNISGFGFSPDFVWIKNRAQADNHKLLDTVRGATKELESNTSDAEVTNAAGLTAFNSDGFDLGADAEYNTSTETYVAWCWDAGSSNSTNTDGSISSQVRANASAGFSIVTYTGNGVAGATIGHGLGVAPEMIIVKNRDQADAWQVYHAANTANPETDYLVLNTTAATADALDRWNDTAPGASVFTLGDGVEVNTNTEDYVAYCFTGVSGYSTSFSYTGNGNPDGPFSYLGFLPKLILIKCSSTTRNWVLLDTEREGYNVDNNPLLPNLTNVEATTNLLDITSNGFKLRSTNVNVNVNAATYVGYAWAKSPFQFSRAR